MARLSLKLETTDFQVHSNFIYRNTQSNPCHSLPLAAPVKYKVCVLINMLRISSLMFVYEEHKNTSEWRECQFSNHGKESVLGFH